MTKAQNFSVSIPFPAWDGIFKVAQIADELRRHELLRGIPMWLQTPRRITMKSVPKPVGFDDCKVVEYWYTGGCFITAYLAGSDSCYGTGWTLISLRIRWTDHMVGLMVDDEKIDILLNQEECATIHLTAHRRLRLVDYEGHSNYSEAVVRLAKVTVASDAVADKAAEPVRVALERKRAWHETLRVQRAVAGPDSLLKMVRLDGDSEPATEKGAL